MTVSVKNWRAEAESPERAKAMPAFRQASAQLGCLTRTALNASALAC